MRFWVKVRQGTFIPGVRGKVSRGGDTLDFPGWLWREVLEECVPERLAAACCRKERS